MRLMREDSARRLTPLLNCACVVMQTSREKVRRKRKVLRARHTILVAKDRVSRKWKSVWTNTPKVIDGKKEG
jgi:hypothetical protein